MLWLCDHQKLFNSFSAGVDLDVRIWRLKSFPSLKGLKRPSSSSTILGQIHSQTTGQSDYPADTRRWTNVGLMLTHRLRRWPNNKTTLVQRLVPAGCGLIRLWANQTMGQSDGRNGTDGGWACCLNYQNDLCVCHRRYELSEWWVELGSLHKGAPLIYNHLVIREHLIHSFEHLYIFRGHCSSASSYCQARSLLLQYIRV